MFDGIMHQKDAWHIKKIRCVEKIIIVCNFLVSRTDFCPPRIHH